MTHKEALEALSNILENQSDYEVDHQLADDILCKIILENLGWKDVTDTFDKIKKWYA